MNNAVYLITALLFVSSSVFSQDKTWTEEDVQRLYSDSKFIDLVNDWLEFHKLTVDRFKRDFAESIEYEQLREELRAFKNILFEKRPNITRKEVQKEVKSFLEKAPYAPDLIQREIRLSELVWESITNKDLIEAIRIDFPMFTQEQIRNMISGKVNDKNGW